MKSYEFDEILFMLGVIICILAYKFEYRIVFILFFLKALFDLFCAIEKIVKLEKDKPKIEINETQNTKQD